MRTIQLLTPGILLRFFTQTTSAQIKTDLRITQFLTQKTALKTGAAHSLLQTLFPEYNLKEMQNICMSVSTMEPAQPKTSRFKYRYQQSFYLAAKIDTIKDNSQTIAEKISNMWNTYQQTGYTACNSTSFDLKDGNLLKLAVQHGFDAFLQDAIKWKPDLNKIDPSDQTTLLDYTQLHITRAKGTALEAKYKSYHQMLRKAGARYKKEL